MVAAILWRKKLVLHRSLVDVFIGVSDNPIMHAPTPRSCEISSAARGGDHSPEDLTAFFLSPELGRRRRDNSTTLRRPEKVGGGME